jgi:transcriptional regulator with XRE-family HTH domain
VDRDEVSILIQRILEEGPFSMKQLADEGGLSYDALRSWASSRRTPRPESLLQLAGELRRRGAHLQRLAAELERAAAGPE